MSYLVKSREQKKAIKAIELLFHDLDDDILKQALLTAYGGEDPAILKEMQEQEQRDLEQILKEMELQKVEEVYDVSCNNVIEKSNDIVDGNN